MRLCMNKKMNTKGEDMHYISVVSIKIDGHCVITKISIHQPPPPPHGDGEQRKFRGEVASRGPFSGDSN